MLLLETGFMSNPHILLETFFQLEMSGYQNRCLPTLKRIFICTQEAIRLGKALADRNTPPFSIKFAFPYRILLQRREEIC